MKKRISIFIFTFFIASKSFSQFSVFANSNGNSLVNQIVGSGVQVSNVTLNCNSLASGIFTSTGTNLGLNSGIILSTAEVAEAVGPNDSPGGTLLGTDGCFNSVQSFFDNDILGIEPLAKYDGCALEFDLKPACNVLKLKYVFVSEEYPEYVTQGYNDAFGFFIWGPNPAGGNYTGTNIALLPGTNTPVSIDNVNSTTNANYYVNNQNGNYIEYDGFTTPFTSSIDVTSCGTYHLKFVIADAGDCRYSSAVLLSQGGLTCEASQSPQTTASVIPVTCGNNGTATLNVQNYSGNITYFWQPTGQTTSSISNLAPGTYTCTLGFLLPCPFTQTISVNVPDDNAFNISATTQNSYCNTPSGIATVTVSGGTLPYSIPIWNTVPQQNTNSVDSLLPGIYTVSMSDATGCNLTSTVTIGNTTPAIIFNNEIIQSTCGSSNGTIRIDSISGGVAPYNYYWNTTPILFNQQLNGPAGTYSLTITDANNCLINRVFTITNSDSLLASTIISNESCNLANGSIHVDIVNGVAPYQWNWSNGTVNQDSLIGLDEGQYSVNIQDATGCSFSEQISLTNNNYLFNGSPFTVPAQPKINEAFQLGIDVTNGWQVNQILINNELQFFNDSLIDLLVSEMGSFDAVFYLSNSYGCIDTVNYQFEINDELTLYIPNTFVPNKTAINNTWKVYGTLIKTISIAIYNRWGELVFESTDIEKGWDGTFSSKNCQEDTYVYKVSAEDFFGNQKQYSGHLNLIR